MTVKKGDVYSRTRDEQIVGDYHYSTRRVTRFMIVTSVRGGRVYARRCEHKRQAQHDPDYCERVYVDLDGFDGFMRRSGWTPDTLEDEAAS